MKFQPLRDENGSGEMLRVHRVPSARSPARKTRYIPNFSMQMRRSLAR